MALSQPGIFNVLDFGMTAGPLADPAANNSALQTRCTRLKPKAAEKNDLIPSSR